MRTVVRVHLDHCHLLSSLRASLITSRSRNPYKSLDSVHLGSPILVCIRAHCPCLSLPYIEYITIPTLIALLCMPDHRAVFYKEYLNASDVIFHFLSLSLTVLEYR